MLKIGQLTRPIFPVVKKWSGNGKNKIKGDIKFQWVQLTSWNFQWVQTDKFFNEFNWVPVSSSKWVFQLLLGHPPKGPTLWKLTAILVLAPVMSIRDPAKLLFVMQLDAHSEYLENLPVISEAFGACRPTKTLPLKNSLTAGAWDGRYNVCHPTFEITSHPGSWGVTCEDRPAAIALQQGHVTPSVAMENLTHQLHAPHNDHNTNELF